MNCKITTEITTEGYLVLVRMSCDFEYVFTVKLLEDGRHKAIVVLHGEHGAFGFSIYRQCREDMVAELVSRAIRGEFTPTNEPREDWK